MNVLVPSLLLFLMFVTVRNKIILRLVFIKIPRAVSRAIIVAVFLLSTVVIVILVVPALVVLIVVLLQLPVLL